MPELFLHRKNGTPEKKNSNFLIMKYILAFKNETYTYEMFLKDTKNSENPDVFMVHIKDLEEEQIKKVNQYSSNLDDKDDYCVIADGTNQTVNKTVIKPKLKRNEKCNCASGKKFKVCCLNKDVVTKI